MSKVFSAKRQKVEFEYEFTDGSKVSMIARSLSTKEQKEISNIMKQEGLDIAEAFKDILKMQFASNDIDIVNRILEEQYEEGDIVEFSNSISEMIKEEKAKK